MAILFCLCLCALFIQMLAEEQKKCIWAYFAYAQVCSIIGIQGKVYHRQSAPAKCTMSLTQVHHVSNWCTLVTKVHHLKIQINVWSHNYMSYVTRTSAPRSLSLSLWHSSYIERICVVTPHWGVLRIHKSYVCNLGKNWPFLTLPISTDISK